MQHLLHNTETGRETKIDLYIAVQMTAAAWSALKRDTPSNCFRHSGFLDTEVATSSPEAEDQLVPEEEQGALIASQ